MSHNKNKLFSSYVRRIFNDYRVVVITHEVDDFGNRRNCENLLTIEEAKEMMENLKNTIEEYEYSDKR